tara:strand:- start:4729 stop:7722 length:2994 start_codon:yes stop_codon:yes gene_type:complete
MAAHTPLIAEYYALTDKYIKEYGRKCVVFMQVGSFYEVYGTAENCETPLHDIAKICELKIASKHNPYLMSGFPLYQLDKFVRKLQDAAYTVVVYVQDETQTNRIFANIYSPGTFFSTESDVITNSVSCIWIFNVKSHYIIGMANIDIITGQSVLYECKEQILSPTFDESERFLSIHNPHEIIYIHAGDLALMQKFIKFTNTFNRTHYLIDINEEEEINSQRATKCEKQVYQHELFNKFFKKFDFKTSFNEYSIAIQSMTFLLDWVWRHNPNLVCNIQNPIFENYSNNMILANHSLIQLNVLNDNKINNSTNSCLLNLINKCVTPMGKRLTYKKIVHPMICDKELTLIYEIVDHIISEDLYTNLRSLMSNIKDIEKFYRKVLLKKVTPVDIYHIHTSLQLILDVYNIISRDKRLETFFANCGHFIYNTIEQDCMKLKSHLESIFNIELCVDANTIDLEYNIIKSGYSETHDEVVSLYANTEEDLNSVKNFLSSAVKKCVTRNNSKNKNDFVNITKTDRFGYQLTATQKRGKALVDKISSIKKMQTQDFDDDYDDDYDDDPEKILLRTFGTSPYLKSMKCNFNSLDLQSCNGSAEKTSFFTNEHISTMCSTLVSTKSNMLKSQNEIFKEFLNKFTYANDGLFNISVFVAHLDYVCNISYISKKNNYCRPEIIKLDKDKAHVNAKGLRHPLIERLLQDEIYVPNDVNFDVDNKGLLLFGTNAVGKSSFIKSLGISIIMAQAGFFVPCSSFHFFPFKKIFTRIIGNDNIFKGLSTFAVEMLEFKNIIENVCENSIVLGDELCSGTETDSAISIVIAGINKLYKERCAFVFATHFHEIVGRDEISNKPALSIKHMAVAYDISRNCLIYDRTLKTGPGDSMYGLEVCKSLHLPKDFLTEAHEIRTKYNKGSESLLDYKPSKYNAKKLKGGLCEFCHENPATDVHHLVHQEDADEDGFISGFHKNHVANLSNICEKCHKEIHKLQKKLMKKKTTRGDNIFETVS